MVIESFVKYTQKHFIVLTLKEINENEDRRQWWKLLFWATSIQCIAFKQPQNTQVFFCLFQGEVGEEGSTAEVVGEGVHPTAATTITPTPLAQEEVIRGVRTPTTNLVLPPTTTPTTNSRHRISAGSRCSNPISPSRISPRMPVATPQGRPHPHRPPRAWSCSAKSRCLGWTR